MKRVALVAVISVTLVATACGGGESGAPSQTREIVALTTTTPPPFDETDLKFSEEFWHSGFRVELNRAEVWTSTARFTNRTSYWLTLWGDFENLGDEVASFEPEMAIEESGVAYVNRTGDPPRLLPETSALGELTFLIPEDLDLESAEFVIGAPSDNQARIPLGGSGPATRLEPTEVVVVGQTATELIDLEFTGATLRFDVAATHKQLEMGKVALTLYFDVTSRVPGDHRLLADDIALVLPDGSTTAPIHTALDEVPGDAEGVTSVDHFVTFVVDVGTSGDFTLCLPVDDVFIPEDGDAEIMFGFNL